MTRACFLGSEYNVHLLNVLTLDSLVPWPHPSQSSSTLVIPGQETVYLGQGFSSHISLLMNTIQLFLCHRLPIVSPPQGTLAHLQSLCWPSALWGKCTLKCTASKVKRWCALKFIQVHTCGLLCNKLPVWPDLSFGFTQRVCSKFRFSPEDMVSRQTPKERNITCCRSFYWLISMSGLIWWLHAYYWVPIVEKG